jgi:hypothetical protein
MFISNQLSAKQAEKQIVDHKALTVATAPESFGSYYGALSAMK